MPKPKQCMKMHSKGKTSSLQKSVPEEIDNADKADPDETMRQFQLELVWCIQQLERTLNDKKGTEKQLQEAWKVLTVLKNNNQPMVRKRQLMRTHFGDYRAKMQAEEKKIAKMASKMKITESLAQPKATFLRKSAFLTTGDEAFRFNFNLAPDQQDVNNTVNIGDIPTPSGNATEDADNTQLKSSGDSKEVKNQQNKHFKFNFTNSPFKFNFGVSST